MAEKVDLSKPFKLSINDGVGMPLIPAVSEEKKEELKPKPIVKPVESEHVSVPFDPFKDMHEPEIEPVVKTVSSPKKKKRKKRKKKTDPESKPPAKKRSSEKDSGGKIWPVAVVLIIIFAGFYIWYSPHLGMPLLGWQIDDDLTDQFIEEEFEGVVPPDGRAHVIAVGPLVRNEPNSRAVRYYTKSIIEPFPWSLFQWWQLQRQGMYDYDTGEFIWDT